MTHEHSALIDHSDVLVGADQDWMSLSCGRAEVWPGSATATGLSEPTRWDFSGCITLVRRKLVRVVPVTGILPPRPGDRSNSLFRLPMPGSRVVPWRLWRRVSTSDEKRSVIVGRKFTIRLGLVPA